MSLPKNSAYLSLVPILLVILVLVSGCLVQPPVQKLTYYTEQLPPYNYEENGTLKGFSVEILEAIAAKTGDTVTPDTIHLVPWTEGYRTVLSRNDTVLFTTVRIPEREQSFKWAGPIYTYTNVLFARPDRNIVISSADNLKKYRIGVIADDIAIQQLLDAGVNVSQLVTETNVSPIIAKLNRGEIDLWACPEMTGRYFALQETGNSYTFKVVYTLPAHQGYYAFNRDVPDSTVKSFQKALDAIKTEKDPTGTTTYERILGRYVPSLGFAHLNYLTEEWAPFNYNKDGVPQGISVDILEAAFRSMGVNRSRADVHIVPLSEGLHQAQGNTSTVLFSIVRTPEREQLFQWAGPFTRAGFVVFAPGARQITIRSPTDMNRYRIGVVKDSVENTLLTSRGVKTSAIISGSTPADMVKMLEKGEIDLWATGDVNGRYVMMSAGLNPDAYDVVYTLSENDFYYVFSRDVPDTLVSAFSQALSTIREQKNAQGISEYERIIYQQIGVGCTRQPFSDDKVIALVETTARAVEKNAPDTFLRINAGEPPYRDIKNPALYAFVYDMNLTVVAHADNIRLVGNNFRGKTDVAGRPFRDEILAGAKKNGTGWVEYVYQNPVQTNLFYKTTYYRLTKGSDGNYYIVCSGNFRACKG